MKRSFNVHPELDRLAMERMLLLGISSDEFWNIAGQNFLIMSKYGLPEPNQINQFNWQNINFLLQMFRQYVVNQLIMLLPFLDIEPGPMSSQIIS